MSEISILEKSIPQIDVNQSVCPFCNEPQRALKGVRGSNKTMFALCECMGMRNYRDLKNKLSVYEEQLLIVNRRIESNREYAARLLKESGIGKRYYNLGFESYDRDLMPKAYDTALKFAEDFLNNKGNGLILTGDVGTGKTHLATAIANHVIKCYGVAVYFVNYVELLAEMRAAFSTNTGNVAKIEANMCESALLIIDDLGKEKQSMFTNELLYRVVNKRYKERLPLIITSNYGLQDLSYRLDYAVFSRIVGMCKAVDMRGNDYRVKEYLD